jgi:hypothetical protein
MPPEGQIDVDIKAEVCSLLETFRNGNTGRVDPGIERLMKRLAPRMIEHDADDT